MPPLALLLLLVANPDGLLALRERRFAEAEAAFRNVLRQHPSDAMTRLYLARTLIELDRAPEAIAEIRMALTEPVKPEVRFEAGRILREVAEQRLARLEAAAPNSPATLELAGERFEWVGNLDQALEQYKTAALRDDGRPGVHYRIGNILWRKRELDAAAAELQRELELTPQHGMANLRMGQILVNADRSREAIPYLERAVAAMPESLEARREAGKAYRKVGRTAEARAAWEGVAKAHPADDQIHYLLGNLYRDLGETDLARQEFERHRALLERRGKQSLVR